MKDLQLNRPDKVTYLANHKKLGCGRGPSCQPLHVQYSSDGSRSLTTLTMPRQSTKVVDDSKAQEGDNAEPGKTR